MRTLTQAVPLAVILLCASSDAARAQQASTTWPAGRACHGLTYSRALGGVVVFGGASFCGQGVVSDSSLWVWNGRDWRRLPGALPSRREDVILAADDRRQSILLFGGRNAGTVHADLWEWRDSSWSQRARKTPDAPAPIEHGAGAFDAARNRLVVFGGGAGGAFSSRTWEWDGARWHASAATEPAARVGHSMVASTPHGVVMYGGFAANGSFRDLWSWNGSRWSLLDSAGPTPTEGSSLVDTEDGLVVAGPGTSDAPPGTRLQLWRWRSGRWETFSDPKADPAPRLLIGSAVAFDRARRRFVIFGGATPTSAAEQAVWEFDGSWRVLAPGK